MDSSGQKTVRKAAAPHRIVEQAPAKINLALHVTGQRQNGYHTLDSLVAFADFGDIVTVEKADADRFSMSGPFSSTLGHSDDNLVLKARALLQDKVQKADVDEHYAVALEKNLPVASGIGGGSADAAATLRALNKIWTLGFGVAELQCLSQSLGADLPMCVLSRAARISGIGDVVVPLPSFPSVPAVLVNPMVEVSTPAIFNGLKTKSNTPMPDLPAQDFTLYALIDYLLACRNDLEPPARHVALEINHVLTALQSHTNCLLARMSGSGATCFALFESDDHANSAEENLLDLRPDWWVKRCRIGDDPFGSANQSG